MPKFLLIGKYKVREFPPERIGLLYVDNLSGSAGVPSGFIAIKRTEQLVSVISTNIRSSVVFSIDSMKGARELSMASKSSPSYELK